LILDTLQLLLECVQEALGDEDPVCRVFINPGPDAPHDVCSTAMIDGVEVNGQLWVAHLGTTSGWPSPTGLPTTCATTFTNRAEIGIVRCVESKLTDDGDIPDAVLITNDALAQERDRQTLLNAIICCMPVQGKDLVIEEWTPIPPAGGCVGGVWTFNIRDAGCSCGSMES
jgi:hypothetical protein